MSNDTLRWLVLLAAGVVGTLVVHLLLMRLVRRLVRGNGFATRLLDAARRPARALLGVVAGWVILGAEGSGPAPHWIRHVWTILTIVVLAWLAVRLLGRAAEVVLHRQMAAGTVRSRTLRTQLVIVRRLGVVLIGTIATVAVLWTFEGMRAIGTSLLASAGVIGIIAGVAAQSTLGNLVAGLQIAFTEPVRLEDAVVVEEEWGQIEEITLTYVVVRLWDLRRLVLPTRYFLEHPFQNWTRESTSIVGSVTLHVNPSCRFDELREATELIVHGSQWFNGDGWSMQVVDSTEFTAVLRVTATANDASAAWELRCDIREGVLEWLQEQQPDALPAVTAGSVLARNGPSTSR